ncbi:hypothetical protein GOV06_04240 [Candidatus Woesearchaeota archaeon]|nr:hypothetical protein [Candidatus Woesearchaeota archaeon]
MKQAQIQNEDALCIVCREAITNPLCPECLAKEVGEWLRYRIPSLAGEFTWPRYETGVKCIKCGSHMGICAHCYLKDIYDSMWEITPMLAAEFLETFDFGLRRELL